MSNNEMIPATNYTALKNFNLAEAMASEMNGMDVSFDRVTIPAAGGTTFELPGELPGETDAAKEFTGVILYHHPLFAYYRERFNGGNNAPDCGSYDGVTGVGKGKAEWERCMIAKRRKTLVVCYDCHLAIHGKTKRLTASSSIDGEPDALRGASPVLGGDCANLPQT